jgi:hypothetical protein
MVTNRAATVLVVSVCVGSAWKILLVIARSNSGVCLSVCGDKQGNNRLGGVCLCGQCWKILPVTARSLWSPVPVCGDKQGKGRAGQGGHGSRCEGPGEVPFLLKKSLGKTGGLASNQTKIQFLKKFIFIIENIKKTRIFLKKKRNK